MDFWSNVFSHGLPAVVAGCCEATPGEVKKVFEKVAQTILRMPTVFHMPFFRCVFFFLIADYVD